MTLNPEDAWNYVEVGRFIEKQFLSVIRGVGSKKRLNVPLFSTAVKRDYRLSFLANRSKMDFFNEPKSPDEEGGHEGSLMSLLPSELIYTYARVTLSTHAHRRAECTYCNYNCKTPDEAT